MLIMIDPSVSGEFMKTDTQERSDAFWRKYLRRAKARRQYYRYKEGRYGSSYSEWIDLRKEEDTILSMSAHPSMLASFMSVSAPGSDERTPWMGLCGAKGEVSNRTLAYAILALNEFVLPAKDIPFGPTEEHDARTSGKYPPRERLLEYNDSNELHRHIKKGRNVLPLLAVYTLYAEQGSDLATERSIDHWFDAEEQEPEKP
jgi:hypothetical protein